MYKLLLCVRYLQTRYLAFICIVSVMLGVATLIVVNAVMSGFSTKLKDRLHGVLSDIIIDTDRMDGFDRTPPDRRHDRRRSRPARRATGSRRSRPTIEVFAILQFRLPRAGRHQAGAAHRHRPGGPRPRSAGSPNTSSARRTRPTRPST